jgi:hypothetical protein
VVECLPCELEVQNSSPSPIKKKKKEKNSPSQVLVAHTCNPSYSGGRDQKDHGSKSSWANSSQNTISRKIHHKKRLVEWLKVKVLSSNPNIGKKKTCV